MENYLSQQRSHVFSNVGVLIYVFDIESRDFERDLLTYRSIINALQQYSGAASSLSTMSSGSSPSPIHPSSPSQSPASSRFAPTNPGEGPKVFILIHKMDLVQPTQREELYNERVELIKSKSLNFIITPFATSIWDQSLYKAWAEIIHDLIPNLSQIEAHLSTLGNLIDAEEILLFERSSFLVVSSWTSSVGIQNPTKDRFERLSNIIKNFKQTTARYTGTPKSAEQFILLELKLPRFCLFAIKFTTNTYLMVVIPPGEARFNSALESAKSARAMFEELDAPIKLGPQRFMESSFEQPGSSTSIEKGKSTPV